MPLPVGLGGEERIEHARRDVGDMPTPVSVTAINANCPGRTSGFCRAIGVVEIGVGGFDRELAAVRHGVAGVDRDVEDGVLELLGVGVDRPQAGRGHGLDLDVLAQGRMQQIRHVGDHLVGVERLRRQRLLAREREQPLGQRGGALAGDGGGIEKTLDAVVALGDAALDQVERAHDDAQHIVEVVGDAAGELAERLHLLRLTQLTFGRFAACHLIEQLPVGERKPVAGGGECCEGARG